MLVRPVQDEGRSQCSTPSSATIPKTSSAPGPRRRTPPSWPSSAPCSRSSRRQGRLGPVARLLPTTAATTLRKGREPLVIDGPFAETKEQLLGFYVVDCATLEEAIEAAKDLARASGPAGAYEIRPIALFRPGDVAA